MNDLLVRKLQKRSSRTFRHSCVGGNPAKNACRLDSRFRGNDMKTERAHFLSPLSYLTGQRPFRERRRVCRFSFFLWQATLQFRLVRLLPSLAAGLFSVAVSNFPSGFLLPKSYPKSYTNFCPTAPQNDTKHPKSGQ